MIDRNDYDDLDDDEFEEMVETINSADEVHDDVEYDEDGELVMSDIDKLNWGLCPHGAADDEGCDEPGCRGGPNGWV
jgi:hypothetical protein